MLFLLDANLSPLTANHLRKLGHKVDSITESRLGNLTDEEIIRLAKNSRAIVITFDLDFGEIYHEKEEGRVGIIVLRIKSQTVENVNKVLWIFFEKYGEKIRTDNQALIVIKENSVRIVN